MYDAAGRAAVPWRLPQELRARVAAARLQLNSDAAAALPSGGGAAGGAGSPPAASNAARGISFAAGPAERVASSRSPLDYEAVIRTKMSLLRELYRVAGDDILGSAGFARFFRENSDWLQAYALWRFFSELHGVADPAAWGVRATIKEANVHALVDPSSLHYRAVAFWYFVQYLLHTQASAAARHARQRGVVLQVHVSAGLPRTAADVWVAPHLFKTNRSLGAPPDAFAREGQNWQFPPYDWAAMEKEDFAWWRRR
jgi:4-alpha-glucanotransferase